MRIPTTLRSILVFGALSASLASLPSLGLADPPATHGMAVFGQKHLYFSHLPMFHSPHDYQAIFSGSFDPTGLAAYEDPAANPLRMFYTMEPEPFVLPELADEVGNRTVVKRAKLFTGVFDEDGTVISSSFSVSFTKVLYFRKFVPGERNPSHPSYLVLGYPGSGIFVVHLIHAPPDFDQIIQVRSVGPAVSGLLRNNGICQVSMPGIDGDSALAPGASVSVSVVDSLSPAPTTTETTNDTIQLGSQIYFNSEDLAQ